MASWKKIIVSGSIAEFNHISASGDIVPVSDGVSNLGSAGQEFQDLFIDGTAHIDLINMPHEGKIDFGGDGIIEASGNNNQIYLERNASGGQIGIYTTTPQSTLDITGDLSVSTHISASGNISGSVSTTGSFGRIQTGNANNTFGGHVLTLAGDFTTQNNNVTINAAGAARTITLNESLTIGDGNDGTLTFSAGSKTLTVEDDSTVNQDLTTDADVTFGSVTSTNNVTVGGDLVVNGATTTVATTNLVIQDAFGFFATGSAGANADGGIIVQSGSADLTGSALYHDKGAERWSVAKTVASSGTAVTPLESVVTVKQPGDDGAPETADVEYGVGEMFINDDGTIWIYS